MQHSRHRGFVLGSDYAPKGQKIWKVRVKDPQSPFNGQKLVVASISDGIALAQGLNVNFVIGTVDDLSGAKTPRAVDVCLEVLDNGHKRSGGQT